MEACIRHGLPAHRPSVLENLPLLHTKHSKGTTTNNKHLNASSAREWGWTGILVANSDNWCGRDGYHFLVYRFTWRNASWFLCIRVREEQLWAQGLNRHRWRKGKDYRSSRADHTGDFEGHWEGKTCCYQLSSVCQNVRVCWGLVSRTAFHNLCR